MTALDRLINVYHSAVEALDDARPDSIDKEHAEAARRELAELVQALRDAVEYGSHTPTRAWPEGFKKWIAQKENAARVLAKFPAPAELSSEAGDALLKCSDKLCQLAAMLPPDAELRIGLTARREMDVTIYLREPANNAYRYMFRLEPNESSDYERQRLAELWSYALCKLGLCDKS